MMNTLSRSFFGRIAKRLAVAGVALAVCLTSAGCANINIDAKGYRKYWEPYAKPADPNDRDRPAGTADRLEIGNGPTTPTAP